MGSMAAERDDRVLEITLTSQEAQTGVTVPVDIPEGPMPLCQGRVSPISICAGVGLRYTHGSRRLTLNIPSGVASGTTQRLCLANNHLSIVVRVKVR
jgi:hypothetical protein